MTENRLLFADAPWACERVLAQAAPTTQITI
jgi:hypothetical protein